LYFSLLSPESSSLSSFSLKICLSILFGYAILFSSSTTNIWTSMLWSVAPTLVFSKRISSMTISITMGVLACNRDHGQSWIIIEDVWKRNNFLVQPLNKAAHEHLCEVPRNIGKDRRSSLKRVSKTILLVSWGKKMIGSLGKLICPTQGKGLHCDISHVLV